MRKILLLLVCGLISVLIAAVVVFTLSGIYDVPLSQEVQKALSRTPQFSETQMRAGYFLLGLWSGAHDQLEDAGRELWAHHDEADFGAKVKAHDPWKIQFEGCTNGPCTVKSLDRQPQLVEFLKSDREPLQNYIHLMEYGEGATLVPEVSGLVYKMHRLFLLQLAVWLRHGGEERVMDLLISSSHYFHGFYSTGSSFERTIAFACMAENLNFLTAAREENPKLHLKREVVDALAVPDPDDILLGAMDQETQNLERQVSRLAKSGHFETVFSDTGENGPLTLWDSIRDHIAKAGLRPNETVNKFYEISTQALSSDCPPGMDLQTCVPSARWLNFRTPLDYFSNPTGRYLTRLFVTVLAGTSRRAALKNKIEKMVVLKAELDKSL